MSKLEQINIGIKKSPFMKIAELRKKLPGLSREITKISNEINKLREKLSKEEDEEPESKSGKKGIFKRGFFKDNLDIPTFLRVNQD